jgi:hypothetical protein
MRIRMSVMAWLFAVGRSPSMSTLPPPAASPRRERELVSSLKPGVRSSMSSAVCGANLPYQAAS